MTTFSKALEALKAGKVARRSGWNGKGMFLYHVPENQYPARTEAAKNCFGDMVPYGAYIAMKTAQGNVVPWLASQTDLLTDDWEILAVMKDQHKKIKGYRDLTQEEIDLMNEAKELAEQCRLLVDKVRTCNTHSQSVLTDEAMRWLAIGRTDLQKGFMGVIRAIAKPTTF